MIYLNKKDEGVFCECALAEEGTHVFFEKREYDLKTCNMERNSIYERGWNGFAQSGREEAESVQREIDELDARIENVQKEIAKQDETADWFRATFADYDQDIANLLRMARERSNAARNLRPKKDHHGYRLVYIGQEKVFARRSMDGSGNNIVGYKTTIETPYPARVHVEDIAEFIEKELIGKAFYGDLEILHDSIDEIPEVAWKDNVVYRYEFSANFRDQEPLWTITLHSVHELDVSGLLK